MNLPNLSFPTLRSEKCHSFEVSTSLLLLCLENLRSLPPRKLFFYCPWLRRPAAKLDHHQGREQHNSSSGMVHTKSGSFILISRFRTKFEAHTCCGCHGRCKGILNADGYIIHWDDSCLGRESFISLFTRSLTLGGWWVYTGSCGMVHVGCRNSKAWFLDVCTITQDGALIYRMEG